MIVNGFLNIVLSIFRGIFSMLPDISLNLDSGLYTTFMDMVEGVIYLLPMNTIFQIFGLIGSFLLFRIAVAIPKAIWEILPFA